MKSTAHGIIASSCEKWIKKRENGRKNWNRMMKSRNKMNRNWTINAGNKDENRILKIQILIIYKDVDGKEAQHLTVTNLHLFLRGQIEEN
jgi:hypothetical protein